MEAKRCGSCGLVHPATAVRCECGYRFGQPGARREAERRISAQRDAAARAIWLGAFLTGIGALSIVVALATPQGPTVLLYGPAVIGVPLLVRGLLRRRDAMGLRNALPDDADEGDASVDKRGILARKEDWHRVIGHKCVMCARNIFAIADGDLCSTCSKPFHHECAEEHAFTHVATPYRS